MSWPGAPLAITAAALFGASTPFAKLLLGDGVSPWLLAGLLYLGSGVALGAILLTRRLVGVRSGEAALSRADLPWLALVILAGGIFAPFLLMLGLATTPAASAALLLNVEGLATMAIAWIAFHESVDRRLLFGAAAILIGALLLSWSRASAEFGLGALAIVGACCAWGLDNNLTRRLSAVDPVQLAAIKGGIGGVANVALALATGSQLPAVPAMAGAAVTGVFGYGLSLVLFILALRHLGAARTSAYFSTGPFVGAALSLALFREPLSGQFVIAGLLMAIGVYLHLTETHIHEHLHEATEHDHRHHHDEHHQHDHESDDAGDEPHTHRHRHLPTVHSHPHYPDTHHRHRH